MKRTTVRNVALAAAGLLVGGVAVFLVGCVRESNGVLLINEAPLPKGWPKLTRVGEVEVKQCPAYRAAVIEDRPGDAKVDPMFGQLFDHIKANDIAMTAPVEMGYQDDPPADTDGQDAAAPATPAMASMAFLYREPEMGQTGGGSDGDPVVVRDLPPRTFASIGVRGDYTDQQLADALDQLRAWLAANPAYTADGPPRTLGYNSPFVPAFMRYGEVQLPVTRAD